MPRPQAIRVAGLREFVRGIKAIDSSLPKTVRLALNRAVQVVIDYGKPKMPRRTGRAAATIRGASTRTAARVSEGGARAQYVPWLDFGGKVGKNKSVSRKFFKEGRYLYPALRERSEQITESLAEELASAASEAGIEVSSG